MRNQKLRNIRPRGAFCPEVRVSGAFFFLVQNVEGDLYDVRVLYLAWLPKLALVIYPFPAILSSYNIYLYLERTEKDHTFI
jgi:hypothetical protein